MSKTEPGRGSHGDAVAFVCDAGPEVGIGHVMRCLALAEELIDRGAGVVLVADLAEVPWAEQQVRRRGISVRPTAPGETVVDAVAAVAPRAVVVDSYLLDDETYAALHASWPLLAVVDGDPRGRVADLYLDQNLGSEDLVWPLPDGARHLGGLTYAQQRRDIVRHRPAAPKTTEHDPLAVLAFFGGTDAFGVAPQVARLVAATGVPCDLTVIAATPELAERIREVVPAPGQSVQVLGPTDRLPELVAEADVVLSATGTSAWELFCLGAAVGFVCVADNQAAAYAQVDKDGLAVGAGTLAELSESTDVVTSRLHALLSDRELRERLRRACWSKVDGLGAARVADALLDAGDPIR